MDASPVAPWGEEVEEEGGRQEGTEEGEKGVDERERRRGRRRRRSEGRGNSGPEDLQGPEGWKWSSVTHLESVRGRIHGQTGEGGIGCSPETDRW